MSTLSILILPFFIFIIVLIVLDIAMVISLVRPGDERRQLIVWKASTYTLFDKLDLTAGLRYEYEKNKLDYASDYLAGGMVVPGMARTSEAGSTTTCFCPRRRSPIAGRRTS